MLRKLRWWIRGHLTWKPTDVWIDGNKEFGDYSNYGHVPQKLMSKWEWWVKWSNPNGC